MSRHLPYELTCPSCGHAERLSFVRVEAVAVCAACGHRFGVGAKHLRHLRPAIGLTPVRPSAAVHGVRGMILSRFFKHSGRRRVAIGACLVLLPTAAILGFVLAGGPARSPSTGSTPTSSTQPPAATEGSPVVVEGPCDEAAVPTSPPPIEAASPEVAPSTTVSARSTQPDDVLGTPASDRTFGAY